MLTYRQFGSIFEGHPTPRIPWVDVATGSLGQGLPIGVGMAIAGKYLDRLPYRVWVLSGDSETAEGSIWEAFEHACALRARQPDRDPRRQPPRPARPDDGRVAPRPVPRARRGVRLARDRDRRPRRRGRSMPPTRRRRRRPASRRVIIARTIKGKGVKAVENKEGWHGKPLDDPEAAIEELGGLRNITVEVAKPEPGEPHVFETGPLELPRYELGSEVATRKAYGEALAARRLGARRRRRGRRRGLELDLRRDLQGGAPGPVLRDVHRRAADGRGGGRAPGARLARRSPRRSPPSTRARTTSSGWRRSSRATMCLSGSHAGISIGEDGPSQMALEDMALAARGPRLDRPPSRATATRPRSSSRRWPTSRGSPTSARCARTRRCSTGRTRSSRSAAAESCATATTVDARRLRDHGARGARRRPSARGGGDHARVIDCYSIKPIDGETLAAAAEETGQIVIVEDHWPEGGLGEAVLAALAERACPARVTRLAVTEMPRSGKPDELLAAFGIDAERSPSAAPRTRPRPEPHLDPVRRHGRRDRNQPAQGARRRAALRRRLVQGRAARAARALRPERRRQDDAAADARRRDRLRRRPARRSTRARASRCTTSGRRSTSACRCASTRSRARATWSRSRRSCAARGRRWRPATTGRRRCARYSEAQARLEHAGGYAWRENSLSTLRGLGFADDELDRPLDDVLRRRADAGVAGPGAGRRSRPAAPRRADEPPRRRAARVARARRSSGSTRP